MLTWSLTSCIQPGRSQGGCCGVAERKPQALIDSLYLCFLRYNACIHQCFDRRTKGAGNMVNGLANNAEIDDSSNCDATVVLLKKGK